MIISLLRLFADEGSPVNAYSCVINKHAQRNIEIDDNALYLNVDKKEPKTDSKFAVTLYR